MALPRLVILASGSGSNAEALMRACADGMLEATVAAVITNNADARVIDRAAGFGVPVDIVEHRGRDPEARAEADRRLIATVQAHDPDLVVLAGWMRILGGQVGAALPIINLHPALPGQFPGVGAIERAFAAWQAGDITESGVMVHWVPDAGVDVGPVVATAPVRFESADNLEAFKARMHAAEHELIVRAVRLATSEIE